MFFKEHTHIKRLADGRNFPLTIISVNQLIDIERFYRSTSSGEAFFRHTTHRSKQASTGLLTFNVNADFVKKAVNPRIFAAHHFLKCLLQALKKVLFKPTTDGGTALGQRLKNDPVAREMTILCKSSSAAS